MPGNNLSYLLAFNFGFFNITNCRVHDDVLKVLEENYCASHSGVDALPIGEII